MKRIFRSATVLAFAAFVTLWAALGGLETGERRYFVWYAVAAALGAYTHLTMILVVVGHALAAAVFLLAPGRALGSDRGHAMRARCAFALDPIDVGFRAGIGGAVVGQPGADRVQRGFRLRDRG